MANVLDYLKLESGQCRLAKANFSLIALLHGVIQQAERDAASQPLPVTIEWGAGVPGRLQGDAEKLQKVLEQLIRNAQKHTAEDYRAEKVMFIIITDGEENSSREYSVERDAERPHQRNCRRRGCLIFEQVFFEFNEIKIQTTMRNRFRFSERAVGHGGECEPWRHGETFLR